MAALTYETGTISLVYGTNPRRFNGTGTAWVTAGILPGDEIKRVGNHPWLLITEVGTNGQLDIAEDYPAGGNVTNSPYIIKLSSPARVSNFTVADEVRTLLRHLGILNDTSKIITVRYFDLTVPEGDEIDGDLIVVAGSGATGAFAGKENRILRKNGSSWDDEYSDVITAGWISYVSSTGEVFTWDGSAWSRIVGLGVGINFIPGPWDDDAQYIPGDIKVHNRVAWIASQEHMNEEPVGGSAYWEVFSRYPDFGGAISFAMKFDVLTANSQPADGYLRLSSATQASIGMLRMSLKDVFGKTITDEIAELGTSTNATKAYIRLCKDGDPSTRLQLRVTAVTSQTGYRNLSCTVVGASGSVPFSADDDLVAFCTTVADKGADSVVAGPTGATGQMGGPVAIPLTFKAATDDDDEGAGTVKLGSATQNLSVVLRVDLLNSSGGDITSLLDSLATASTSDIKAAGRLVHHDTPHTKYLNFNITAIASPVGYRNITIVVTGQSAASPFADNDPVDLLWVPKGDKGDQGDEGDQGEQGEGLDYDSHVALLTGRATYDGEVPGYRVLVSDTGDGRAGIYTRVTSTPGVWEGPAYIAVEGTTTDSASSSEIQSLNTLLAVRAAASGFAFNR